jgi:hypothetical protein
MDLAASGNARHRFLLRAHLRRTIPDGREVRQVKVKTSIKAGQASAAVVN